MAEAVKAAAAAKMHECQKTSGMIYRKANNKNTQKNRQTNGEEKKKQKKAEEPEEKKIN